MRERQINIRLSDREAERLDRVAAHYELTAAGVFRLLLKREDEMLFAPAQGFADAIAKRGLRDTLAKQTARTRDAGKRGKR